MKNKNILKIKLANLKLEYEGLMLASRELMNSPFEGRIDSIVHDINAVTDKIRRISKQIERSTNRTQSGIEKNPDEVSETSLLELYKKIKNFRKK